jgi:glycosyltransferase involved in cell wall biosynthesis
MNVCIISENAYPVSTGGVSEWCRSLVENMDDVEFSLFTITPEDKLRYELPQNVINNFIVRLSAPKFFSSEDLDEDHRLLLDALQPVLSGAPMDCERISEIVDGISFTAEGLLSSDENWSTAVSHYRMLYGDLPFIPFYFSWISLFYVLYKILEVSKDLPKADVYHSLNAGYGGVLGCLGKVSQGSSLVVSEHGLYLKERRFELQHSEVPEWLYGFYDSFFKSLVKTTYKYSDKVTSVCEDHISYQKSVDPEVEPLVIYNGIDTEKFEYNGTKEDNGEYVVGTVSRITPIKDTLTLIRAANDVVKKHPTKFIILGEVQDEEYYEECLELVDSLGLKGDVVFKGFQDSSKWYHKFDLFILPSLSEGFPLTILEALSSGVPCLATNVGGVPEILEADLLVERWDYEGLATKISVLLQDAERRYELGSRGRRLVESKFNVSKMVDEYRELYRVMA